MIEQILVWALGPVVSWLVCLPLAILALVWGLMELTARYNERKERERHYRNPDSVYR